MSHVDKLSVSKRITLEDVTKKGLEAASGYLQAHPKTQAGELMKPEHIKHIADALKPCIQGAVMSAISRPVDDEISTPKIAKRVLEVAAKDRSVLVKKLVSDGYTEKQQRAIYKALDYGVKIAGQEYNNAKNQLSNDNSAGHTR
jgi:hypothetical protein